MTLEELKNILEATNYQVSYSHFTKTDKNPPPSPPFITYLIDGSKNFFADNKVYTKINSARVELYTKIKDESVEQKLESQFDKNNIPYDVDETWIESEGVYQRIYEIGVF